MMKCELCGREHNGEYGSGRFCSQKCARSFSSNAHRTETNRKISAGLRRYFGPKKKKLCKKCHQEVCKNPKLCKSHFFEAPNGIIKNFGFNMSQIGTDNFYFECEKLRNLLIRLYYVEKKSMGDILKEFHVPYIRTVHLLFKLFEINRRTFSEASCNALLTKGMKLTKNPNTFYKTGKHINAEGKNIYYRSSYELKFMEELDTKGVKYEYEKLHIKYYDSEQKKWRVAIPDFYLPETNTIVEVKSEYTYNKTNMLDKSKQYKKLGYNFKLILDFEEYAYCV